VCCLQIFNVWVEPEVTISVRLEQGAHPAVIFESTECRLKGSSLLSQLGLDKRFVLYFHNELTWQAGSGSDNGSSAQNARALADGGSSGGTGSSSSSSGAGVGSISAQTEVQVWTEVVGVFKAIPRGVLQASKRLPASHMCLAWNAAFSQMKAANVLLQFAEKAATFC
jgi:hypothetical protein